MKERYLLRADRQGYGYKDLLEVAPGRVRLIVTDKSRRRTWWTFLGIFDLAYFVVVTVVLSVYRLPILAWLTSVLGAFWGTAVYTTAIWAGVLIVAALGDFYLPDYLSRHSLQILPLEVLGSVSYGFFQEMWVRSGSQVMRITVNGTRKSVARVFHDAGMQLAETPA